MNFCIREMAPRVRFVQSRRIDETLELTRPRTLVGLAVSFTKKLVFKTSAVIRAWLPRLRIATVGNAF